MAKLELFSFVLVSSAHLRQIHEDAWQLQTSSDLKTNLNIINMVVDFV